MNGEEKTYDLAIVGCGPAGLSAAVNAKNRNLDIVLLGSDFCSPKMHKAAEINNYLGFYKVTGEELRQAYLTHVKQMGISLKEAKVDSIFDQGDYYSLLSRDETFNARAVVLSVGISNEKYFAGEERLVGRGVSYCATCDAPLYRGRTVAVVAYTNEGIEEADYLSEIAEKVYLIPQFPLKKYNNPAVEIIKGKPTAINGESLVDSIKLTDRELRVDGVFIFREVTPPDKLINGLNLVDKHIEVNQGMATNLPGVFAAGDVTGTPYQLGKAVGQGQIAALSAASYIYKLKHK